MFTLIKQFKREFVYGSYLFLILELLATKQLMVTPLLYLFITFIGLLIIFLWFLYSMMVFGRKKVSKKSTVYMTVNLKARMYAYVVMPIVLWFSLSIFLFLNENPYINQAVIVASVFIFFFLFLRTRSSFEKLYSVDAITRFVYDAANIVIFYLFIAVLNRIGLSDLYLLVVVFFFSLISLHHMLYIHRKVDLEASLVSVGCSILITVVTWLTKDLNIYMQPAIVGVLYYLIVTLWNVRFGGSRRFEDYIPAIMYALMSVILILSL